MSEGPETDLEIVCPAELVDGATEEDWREVAAELVELLSDERMPEEMRRDTRARLTSLIHRFNDEPVENSVRG